MAPHHTTSAMEPGEFAIDADKDDDGRALVVRTSEITASEYVVPGTGKTVAEYNDCPESEPVIEVVFVEALNKRWTHWTPEEVLDVVDDGRIFEEGLRTYAYPRSRLRPVGVGDKEHERERNRERHRERESGRERPVRSEPADFGGGESTGVQDL